MNAKQQHSLESSNLNLEWWPPSQGEPDSSQSSVVWPHFGINGELGFPSPFFGLTITSYLRSRPLKKKESLHSRSSLSPACLSLFPWLICFYWTRLLFLVIRMVWCCVFVYIYIYIHRLVAGTRKKSIWRNQKWVILELRVFQWRGNWGNSPSPKTPFFLLVFPLTSAILFQASMLMSLALLEGKVFRSISFSIPSPSSAILLAICFRSGYILLLVTSCLYWMTHLLMQRESLRLALLLTVLCIISRVGWKDMEWREILHLTEHHYPIEVLVLLVKGVILGRYVLPFLCWWAFIWNWIVLVAYSFLYSTNWLLCEQFNAFWGQLWDAVVSLVTQCCILKKLRLSCFTLVVVFILFFLLWRYSQLMGI